MIKFFRQIRQRLVSEGKAGRYFSYAIGEIILVVIGILIALQINNWNNVQSDKQAEIKYLNQIINSLEDNDGILKDKIESDKKILNAGTQLYTHLKNRKVLNDSLKRLLIILQYDQMVTLNTAAFENLKNEGLSLISNDDIKFEIINIYDQDLKYIQTIFANQFENYITTVISPFYSKHFEIITQGNKLLVEPNDYQALLQNRELTNIITQINAMRGYAISKNQHARERIKEVLIKIEDEIQFLKK